MGGQLQPLLFRQSARDASIIAVVASTLLLSSVLATLAPVRRAVKADPNVALRSD